MYWTVLNFTALAVALLFWAIVLRRWRPLAIRTRARIRPLQGGWTRPRPLVSIILPARNESACVEACVRSLLAQDYDAFEIVAVDDCSTDGTDAILNRLAGGDRRLRVIHGEPVPPGWLGKAHAIVQGHRAARGEWLLFTDADTEHAPWLLSAVMARLVDSDATFATALGWQRHPNRGVHLINLAVSTFVFLLLDPRRLEEPGSRTSVVNGQYLIVNRETYEAIGTHAAIRHYSSTDMSLGYLAKLQGWKGLLLVVGGGLQTTMYRSTMEAFQGWSRSLINAAWTGLGTRAGSAAVALSVVAMLALWLAPWLLFWRGLVADDAASVGIGALMLSAGLALMRLRGPWIWAMRATAAMPIGSVVLAAMGAMGLVWAWIHGGTSWKGRLVTTAEVLPPWRPHAPRPRAQR